MLCRTVRYSPGRGPVSRRRRPLYFRRVNATLLFFYLGLHFCAGVWLRAAAALSKTKQKSKTHRVPRCYIRRCTGFPKGNRQFLYYTAGLRHLRFIQRNANDALCVINVRHFILFLFFHLSGIVIFLSWLPVKIHGLSWRLIFSKFA